LLEKAEGVRHVRLDLAPLAIVEVAFADHEESELLVAEQRTLDTLEVDVRALVDLFQLVEAAFREDRRLVRLDDRVEKAIELIAPRPAQLLQARDEFLVLRRPVRQEIIRPLALELQVRALQQEREPMANDVEVPRIQLLLLDEHLLTNADFAEVVQESGIAKLAQLFARERQPAIGPDAAAAPNRLGETDGKRRDATGVTGGRRVSLLDRGDRGGDEPLE